MSIDGVISVDGASRTHGAISVQSVTSADCTAHVDGVSAIFRRVLETTDIDPESDFFTAGGDSLLATRVLSAVARTYGVELTFDEFLLTPTPGTLAAAIAGNRR